MHNAFKFHRCAIIVQATLYQGASESLLKHPTLSFASLLLNKYTLNDYNDSFLCFDPINNDDDDAIFCCSFWTQYYIGTTTTMTNAGTITTIIHLS